MKLSSFCLAASILLSSVPLYSAQSVSGKNKPGYCLDSTKCAPTYSCVSVQTTRSGVTDVKQCLPMAAGAPLCTGTAPGLCPSFSTTWGTAFREISSVCAYIAPESTGGKCLTGAAVGSNNATLTKGGLECLFVQDPNNKTSTFGVIYGCVDFDGSRLLFEKNSAADKLASKFNYSAVIAESCVNPKNPQGSNFVCSSQGTCSPKSGGSMDYACQCNVGFSGTYCEKIVDNKCYNDGVCGGGSCDLAKNECTDCPAGTLGNKCAQCDPTYDSTKVCSGHGTCVAASGTSTLGAGDSGSSASSSAGPMHGSGDGSSASAKRMPSVGDGSAAFASATVKPSNATRFLAASMFQCQCATGYSDVHCAIVVPENKTAKAKKNSTSAPVDTTSAGSAVAPFVGMALAVAIATLSA